MATIGGFKNGSKPEATVNMTAAFGGLLKKAERRFVKDSPVSLLIEDEIELTEKTKTITWQLMTTDDVELVDGGAILHQDGKQLKIEVLSHPGMDIDRKSKRLNTS